MTFFGAIFYAVSAVVLAATLVAVTRREPVHAVAALTVSLLGTALLFYLLGAPILAAFQVILYAGAIMVLFLFIVMMLRPAPPAMPLQRLLRRWLSAVCACGASFFVVTGLVWADASGAARLTAATASPRAFGAHLFERFWLPVEIAGFLLFVALVGALYLGRDSRNGEGAAP